MKRRLPSPGKEKHAAAMPRVFLFASRFGIAWRGARDDGCSGVFIEASRRDWPADRRTSHKQALFSAWAAIRFAWDGSHELSVNFTDIYKSLPLSFYCENDFTELILIGFFMICLID
ncbi:hypothetical protein LQR31_20555 [Chromobacterium vaccinii]|uniref:hypothetical protein n=1 Tax=Chromobacterium vaccinii TaxID=1108595 RepID=UPI001E3361D5|nr:hypothetical protein [Chromobacterium vaccinii]MCD4486868.1 hypothetical protein [Chromobacterium vaccinii]